MSVPGYAALLEGDPAYNPEPAEFAAWLNAILDRGAKSRGATLSGDGSATVAEHGTLWQLAGHTLTLDPASTLADGWRGRALGPGTVAPAGGEGSAVLALAGQWIDIHCDGTAVTLLLGGAQLPSYTVATLPSAADCGAGRTILVTDESGGAVPAFSDGTDWRRMTDRAAVS